MTAAVAFDDVSFAYPDGATVLRNVSLEIPEGSFALVVGATGVGKSTLLRAMNGLVPHFTGGTFSGSVTVDGRSTLAHSPRALADTVGFVPQDPAASFVVEHVEDELAYAMENLGFAPQAMRRRVEETLDLLDIEHLRERSVRTLSGGERQRVAIAAALTPGPRVLVLDEPTSQLDPQGAEDVLAALQRLVHDMGITVALSEHRLERVAGFADVAIGCSDHGKVVMGTVHEIVGRGDLGPPVARLGRLLGWDPIPVTVRDARRRARRLTAVDVPSTSSRDGSRARALLETDGLGASYGRRAAVEDVSLRINEGDIIAVMGRNGSGKTTLLRCLAGLHPPDSGAVRGPEGSPRPGVDAALCPQAPESVLFRDRVRDEIETTLRWTAATESGVAAGGDCETTLEAFGITALSHRHPRDLSAGERLLVATAAIAATGAPVLLLDEPTRGLDRDAKRRLIDVAKGHAAGGGAVVCATHDVELAAELATRVVMLAGGEVITHGSASEVLGDSPVFAPQMARVFGGGWLTPEQVLAAMRLEGAR